MHHLYALTLPHSRLPLFPRKDLMHMRGIPAFAGTTRGYIAPVTSGDVFMCCTGVYETETILNYHFNV